MNSTKEDIRRSTKLSNNLTLENRRLLIVSGVMEVENFDDKSIDAVTEIGKLSIQGENLNIKKLNLELGDLEVEGKISGLNYSDKRSTSSEGFLSKLFK